MGFSLGIFTWGKIRDKKGRSWLLLVVGILRTWGAACCAPTVGAKADWTFLALHLRSSAGVCLLWRIRVRRRRRCPWRGRDGLGGNGRRVEWDLTFRRAGRRRALLDAFSAERGCRRCPGKLFGYRFAVAWLC